MSHADVTCKTVVLLFTYVFELQLIVPNKKVKETYLIVPTAFYFHEISLN